MPETSQTITQVEYNSNAAVSIRINKIIDAINETKYRTTQFNDLGEPYAIPIEVITHLVCLYTEIDVELIGTERDIYTKELKPLRRKLKMNPPNPHMEGQDYWRASLEQIDELDLKLRRLAKKHGFLAKNISDPRAAVLKS